MKPRSEKDRISAILFIIVFLLVVVIVCILLQMLYVTKYQHIDEDDAYYLGTAVTAVQKDGLYRRNPYTGTMPAAAGSYSSFGGYGY